MHLGSILGRACGFVSRFGCSCWARMQGPRACIHMAWTPFADGARSRHRWGVWRLMQKTDQCYLCWSPAVSVAGLQAAGSVLNGGGRVTFNPQLLSVINQRILLLLIRPTLMYCVSMSACSCPIIFNRPLRGAWVPRTTFSSSRSRSDTASSMAVTRSCVGGLALPPQLTPPLLTRARLPVGFSWTRPSEGVTDWPVTCYKFCCRHAATWTSAGLSRVVEPCDVSLFEDHVNCMQTAADVQS